MQRAWITPLPKPVQDCIRPRRNSLKAPVPTAPSLTLRAAPRRLPPSFEQKQGSMVFYWRKVALLFLCITLVGAFSATTAHAQSALWRITKERWDASDEKAWQDFVAGLGAADCWTFDECIKSPANPYRHTDPKTRFYVDCADMPYVLRAYFAWKNGLPFAWQSAMRSADGPGGDIRYSTVGNIKVGGASG